MRTIFSYRGSDMAEFRRNYGEIVRREFYDGDLDAEDTEHLDFTFQKALDYPMGLLRVFSRTGISYRRNSSHIRRNKIGVRVIWFVRHGTLKIVRSNQTCVAGAGECAILDSNAPFHARAIVDEDGLFEAVQAVVPAHLFLTHLPSAVEFASSFKISPEDRQVVIKLLDLLFEEGDHLSRSASEYLVHAFLETISEYISHVCDGQVLRMKVGDKRLADIQNYISRNLTNPDLCYDEVAAKCGISPRYLCHVLKANDTSFSQLLWSQRLPKARDWLVSVPLRDYPIHEIAYMAGFKSAAHFSRMFKTTYGCTPKEFRLLNQDASQVELLN
jgi:AraC family transcriptional regulator, positive regulator of tynA and feaB